MSCCASWILSCSLSCCAGVPIPIPGIPGAAAGMAAAAGAAAGVGGAEPALRMSSWSLMMTRFQPELGGAGRGSEHCVRHATQDATARRTHDAKASGCGCDGASVSRCEEARLCTESCATLHSCWYCHGGFALRELVLARGYGATQTSTNAWANTGWWSMTGPWVRVPTWRADDHGSVEQPVFPGRRVEALFLAASRPPCVSTRKLRQHISSSTSNKLL
eukprot:1016265-Rhodomonas_salina.1